MQIQKTKPGFENEPEWLAKYREKNAKIVSDRPVKKSKYTSIAKLEEILGKAKENREPKINAKGAKIVSVEEALGKHESLLKKALLAEEKPKDQFEAFVNANFSQGFLIMCEGEETEIEINYQPLSPAKIIIVAEKNSVITEKILGNNAVFSETMYVGEDAKATILRKNFLTGNSIGAQQTVLDVNSLLENIIMWHGNWFVRNRRTTVLEGNGSGFRESIILSGKKSESYDLNYTSVHRAQGCDTKTVFKAVLKDGAKSVFDGMIQIDKTGDRTNSLLECHSMILGDKASSNQIPGLEIETDDVKATHSATVARINDEDLFYLATRGIEKDNAQKMIAAGFLEEVAFRASPELRESAEKSIREII